MAEPKVTDIQNFFTLYFDKDMSILPKFGEAAKIDKLAGILKRDGNLLALLTGHASAEGKADQNQRLSDHRADSIKRLLIAKGVSESKLHDKGLGTSRPAVPETATKTQELEEQRRQNRRVDIFITVSPREPVPPGINWDNPPWFKTPPVNLEKKIREALTKDRYKKDKNKPGVPPLPDWMWNPDILPKPLDGPGWREYREKVKKWCEKNGFVPDQTLDMLKGLLFPGEDNAWPTDEDVEKNQRGRQSPPPSGPPNQDD